MANRILPVALSRRSLMLITSGIPRRKIQVREDDLLQKNPPEFVEKFDVIRAANIINRQYFSELALRRMIDNLRGRLRPNGILIICRTHDDNTNNGTIFRRHGSNLQAVDRIGRGSEVAELAVQSGSSVEL